MPVKMSLDMRDILTGLWAYQSQSTTKTTCDGLELGRNKQTNKKQMKKNKQTRKKGRKIRRQKGHHDDD